MVFDFLPFSGSWKGGGFGISPSHYYLWICPVRTLVCLVNYFSTCTGAYDFQPFFVVNSRGRAIWRDIRMSVPRHGHRNGARLRTDCCCTSVLLQAPKGARNWNSYERCHIWRHDLSSWCVLFVSIYLCLSLITSFSSSVGSYFVYCLQAAISFNLFQGSDSISWTGWRRSDHRYHRYSILSFRQWTCSRSSNP